MLVCVRVCVLVCVSMCLCVMSYNTAYNGVAMIRWLRLVGSLKWQVSFAKEPYKRDYILQRRPVILRSLLIVATPQGGMQCLCVSVRLCASVCMCGRVYLCVLCVSYVCLSVSDVCLMCVLCVSCVCLVCVLCVSYVCLMCIDTRKTHIRHTRDTYKTHIRHTSDTYNTHKTNIRHT